MVSEVVRASSFARLDSRGGCPHTIASASPRQLFLLRLLGLIPARRLLSFLQTLLLLHVSLFQLLRLSLVALLQLCLSRLVSLSLCHPLMILLLPLLEFLSLLLLLRV